MLPYWALFLLSALPAALVGRQPARTSAYPRRHLLAPWITVWVILTVMIGYRDQVGGDWQNYILSQNSVVGLDLNEVLSRGDPSFQLLTWICLQMDWGIYGVNAISAAIFSYGLVTFCRRQPRPWLALAVAIPYLVIVVAMGYTRQGVALGLVLMGLVSLTNASTRGFVFWVMLAATFHKSSIVLLPLAALVVARNRAWILLWVGVTIAVLYYLLVASAADALIANYISVDYESNGALVRLLMNFLPATLFIVWRRQFSLAPLEDRLWLWLSGAAVVLLLVFFLRPSNSAAIDRIALYMLPLQLVVFSRLPDAFSAEIGEGIKFPILLYYAAIQFVWLNFATFAFAWTPYRSYLFDVPL